MAPCKSDVYLVGTYRLSKRTWRRSRLVDGLQVQHTLGDGRIVRLEMPWLPLRLHAEWLAAELHGLGCIELCCVGPESAQLHDALDHVLEDKNTYEVHNLAHQCCGCLRYFLLATGGGLAALLARVADHRDLTDLLSDGNAKGKSSFLFRCSGSESKHIHFITKWHNLK